MGNEYFVRLTQCCEATNKQNVKSNLNPATPPPSQVEELKMLYRTKNLFDYMVRRAPRRQTPRRVCFAPLLAEKTFTKPITKWYPKSWTSWKQFRPDDTYFAGAATTAISRKHRRRMELRAARRSAHPPAQPETAHAAIAKAIKDTRTTKRTPMQDKLFSCPKLTLKMQQQEAEIDSLLHGLKHVPRPSLTVTADQ